LFQKKKKTIFNFIEKEYVMSNKIRHDNGMGEDEFYLPRTHLSNPR